MRLAAIVAVFGIGACIVAACQPVDFSYALLDGSAPSSGPSGGDSSSVDGGWQGPAIFFAFDGSAEPPACPSGYHGRDGHTEPKLGTCSCSCVQDTVDCRAAGGLSASVYSTKNCTNLFGRYDAADGLQPGACVKTVSFYNLSLGCSNSYVLMARVLRRRRWEPCLRCLGREGSACASRTRRLHRPQSTRVLRARVSGRRATSRVRSARATRPNTRRSPTSTINGAALHAPAPMGPARVRALPAIRTNLAARTPSSWIPRATDVRTLPVGGACSSRLN